MLKIFRDIEPIYPLNNWEIIEQKFELKHNGRNETAFSLGNGYLGSRGTFEEREKDEKNGIEGNFINGFYESQHIQYGEFGYGYAEKSQTMVNVMNPKTIVISVDGEKIDQMNEANITDYKRTLNMKDGTLIRELIYTTNSGKKIKMKYTRFISMTIKECMAMRVSLTPLNFSGEITIKSGIDGEVENHTRETNPLIDYGPYGKILNTVHKEAENDLELIQKLKTNGFYIGCFASHGIKGAEIKDTNTSIYDDEIYRHWNLNADKKQEITFDKLILIKWSSDDLQTLKDQLNIQLNEIIELGYDCVYELHKTYLKKFWEQGMVEIKGDDALNQALRFNMLHILQLSGKDGLTSAGAKGLTGEGYEGHYFWDTEMYLMPMLSAIKPEISKALLDFRYNTLEDAKQRSLELGHTKGAAYPWRTINGKEASAFFPHSTAQYHINGAIIMALKHYVELTGDETYLELKGCEMAFEVARLWLEIGHFTPLRDNKFCICDVTGPDEYTAIVDNNMYTNLIARECLWYAVECWAWLESNDNSKLQELKVQMSLLEEEKEAWLKAADNMYFPYEKSIGVYGQDDTYLYKKDLSINELTEEQFPLMQNMHPLSVYRYRVSKQADLLLGMLLFKNRFNKETISKHFDYYEPLTLHESSLSMSVFSILSSYLGDKEKAYEYFTSTARMDLDDYHENTYAGVHAANMAGSWWVLAHGFAQMECKDGIVGWAPYCPQKWDGYEFRVSVKGAKVKIGCDKQRASITLIEGHDLEIFWYGQRIVVKNGETLYEEI